MRLDDYLMGVLHNPIYYVEHLQPFGGILQATLLRFDEMNLALAEAEGGTNIVAVNNHWDFIG